MRLPTPLLTGLAVGAAVIGGPAVAGEMEPPTTGTTITDQLTTPYFATSETFRLHSRPQASLRIYLDFTGHTTTGTQWNHDLTDGDPIVTPAYDRDGSPALGPSEHATIQAVWMQVREDFAPFDVDVTTEEPSSEELVATGPDDEEYGVRVVIGPNTGAHPKRDGGGSYIGTFGSGAPAYVFPRPTSKTVAKSIADCVSHEVGHTLGLAHDGRDDGNDYFLGHENWAPLMGASYFVGISQWSRGEYAGADNGQDDLAEISSWLGYAADDYSSGSDTTATLANGRPRFGVIGQTGEADAFRFSLTQRREVKLAAWNNTGPVDANLNLRLRVYDDQGQLIASASPHGDLGAALDQSFPAGTYYLVVDGVGEGDPATTGFSDYGSLGFYGVSASL